MSDQKSDDKILAVIEDGVGHFTINNAAKRNAMSKSMWARMGEVFDAWADDPAVKVVVVRGAGDKCFCAGNDISEFATVRNSPQNIAEYTRITEHAYSKLKTLAKPTIARIEGFCIGGGLELAMLCDMQFAATSATFGVTPAKLGLGYKLEDISLLLESVSAKVAKELLFTGRKFSSDDALRWGLINQTAPADKLDALVENYVSEIAGNAPLTIKAAKLIVAEALKPIAIRDEALCQALVGACHESTDYQEGQRAFAEKRPPLFRGE